MNIFDVSKQVKIHFPVFGMKQKKIREVRMNIWSNSEHVKQLDDNLLHRDCGSY